MNRSIIVSLVASALLVFLSSSLVLAASPPLSWLSLSDHVSPLLLRRGMSPAAVSAHLSLAAPVARSDFAFGYDARRSRLIVFGGKSQESGEVLNDIWSFSLLSLQWTEHRTDSMQMRPPSRFSMVSGVSVSDPNPLAGGVGDDDRFFISTGEGSSGEHFNDLWSFHLRTHIWQQHEISGEQWRKRYGASGGIPISYVFNNNTDIAICSNSSSLSVNSTAAACSLEFVSPVDSLTTTEAQSFVLTHGFSSDRYQDTFQVQLSPLHFAGSESTSPPVSLPSFSASVGSVPFSRCLHAGAIGANGRMALFGGCGSRGHGPCPAYDAHIWHAQSQEWTQADRCPGPRLYASMSIWPDQFQPAQLSSSSSGASPTFVESGLLFGGTGRIFSSGFPGEVNLLDLTSGQWRRLAPVGLRRATMPDGSADFDTPPIQSDDALPPITAHHQTVMVYQPPTELLQLLGIDPSAAGVMTSTDGNSSITAPPALLFAMGGDLGSEIFLLGGSSSATRRVGCPSVFPLRMFHGLVMFLGWGVFIPLAVLFARYGKAIDVLPEPIARYTTAPFALTQLSPCCRRPHQRQQEGKAVAPALWFQLHRLLNTVGLLLIVGGFISAILMVPIHPFTLPHHFLGVIAVAFGLLQPLNAFLRPHPPSGGENKSRSRVVWEHLHRWSGRVGLTLALINIFLGLAVIHAHVGFSIGFAIYLVALALLVLLLERRLRRSTKLQEETAASRGLLADGSGAANAKSSKFNCSAAAAAASGENDLGATGTSGVAPDALALSERQSNSTRILVGSEGAGGLIAHSSHHAMENGTPVSTTTATDSVIEMLNR